MIKDALALYFKATGWTFKNVVPDDVRAFVMIGAPHTSNYDFVPAMAVAKYLRRDAKFVIKNEWTKFPMGAILRPMGAVGIDRTKLKGGGTASYTDVMADLFKQYPDLVLMIAPEGTRGPNPNWKTGFYYIAQKAGVPLALGYADYAKKEAGLGLLLYPTDFEKDMRTIMDFYAGVSGKKPSNFLIDEKYRN